MELNPKIKENYDCDICKDKGYLLNEDNKFIGYCECHKEKTLSLRKEQAHQYLKESHLENVYKRYTFENWKTPTQWHKEYKQQVMKFAKQPSNAFLYLAQSGNGKTHLLSALTVYLIGQGKSGLYIKWQEEIGNAKRNYWNMSQDLVDKMKSVEVLYLDDFLKVETLNDVHKEETRLAFEIIDARYHQDDLITIISSEWNIVDLGRYNEALIGRLVEMAGGINSENIIDSSYKSDGNWRLRKED